MNKYSENHSTMASCSATPMIPVTSMIPSISSNHSNPDMNLPLHFQESTQMDFLTHLEPSCSIPSLLHKIGDQAVDSKSYGITDSAMNAVHVMLNACYHMLQNSKHVDTYPDKSCPLTIHQDMLNDLSQADEDISNTLSDFDEMLTSLREYKDDLCSWVDKLDNRIACLEAAKTAMERLHERIHWNVDALVLPSDLLPCNIYEVYDDIRSAQLDMLMNIQSDACALDVFCEGFMNDIWEYENRDILKDTATDIESAADDICDAFDTIASYTVDIHESLRVIQSLNASCWQN